MTRPPKKVPPRPAPVKIPRTVPRGAHAREVAAEDAAKRQRQRAVTAIAIPQHVPAGSGGVPAVQRAGPILSREQQDILSDWLAAKSPDTVRCYRQWLATFATWLRGAGFAPSGPDHAAVLAMMRLGPAKANWIFQRWANAQVEAGIPRTTYAKIYAAVRSLCKALKRAELVDFIPEAELPSIEPRDALATAEAFAGVPESYRKIIAGLDRLAAAADPDPGAVRDWALVRTGRALGLRRIELVRLDVGDVDLDKGIVRVLGKGRRTKVRVPLPLSLRIVLERWLEVRAAAIGRTTGPLFVSLRRNRGGRMDRGTINALITRRAAKLGLHLEPHDLRRILGTRAIKELGLLRAKALTRHKNVATLEIYDLSHGEQLMADAEVAAAED